MRDFRGRKGNAGFGHPTPPPFPDPVVSSGSIYKIPFDQKILLLARVYSSMRKRLENKTKSPSKVRFNLRNWSKRLSLVGGAKKTKERPRNRQTSPLFYSLHFSRGLWLSFLVPCSRNFRCSHLRDGPLENLLLGGGGEFPPKKYSRKGKLNQGQLLS